MSSRGWGRRGGESKGVRRGLKGRVGRRGTTAKVLKDRRSPRERGRMGTNATDATPPTCVDRDRFTRDVPNDLVFTIPHPSHAQHRSSYFIAMRSMLHESFVGWHSASSAVDGRSLRISFHMYPCGVEMGRGSARWSLPFSGLGSGLELIVVVVTRVRAPPRRRGGGAARSRRRWRRAPHPTREEEEDAREDDVDAVADAAARIVSHRRPAS